MQREPMRLRESLRWRDQVESLGDDRVKVLAVDDQDYFRGVMRAVIDATEGFTVVGEAASGEEALDAVELLAPSLVIIDKRMPGIGGVEACRRIGERYPETVVLMVSIEEPDPMTVGCCAATVSFIRKQDLSPRLLRELWRRHEASSNWVRTTTAGSAESPPQPASPRPGC